MSRKAPIQHTVTVEIAGEKHVLRSDAPPEYTHAVAAHVDAAIRALGPSKPFELHRATTLAALSITDELFRTREQVRRLREELEARAAALTELLEEAAADLPPSPTAAEASVPELPA